MEVVELDLPLPISDNNRLIPTCRGGHPRLASSPEFARYKKLVMPILLHQWGKNKIIVPSVNHQLHIQAKAHVPNWRSDCSNYTKVLKDILTGVVYDDDKWVHVDYLDSVKDIDKPRIVVIIPLDSFSVLEIHGLPEEDKNDEKCTCSRQKLLELGWHAYETTHNPLCPKYKPLVTKKGRKVIFVGGKGLVATALAKRRRKNLQLVGQIR